MIIDVLTKKLNEILNYDITFRVIKSNRPELCDYQSDDIFKLAKLRILVGDSIPDSQKLIEWIYRNVEGDSRAPKPWTNST